MAPRRPQAILFDLDGTLADSLDGIAASMNATLERFAYPTHPIDAYRRFVGDGVHKLVERALPPEADAHARARFLDAYLPMLHERGTALARPYGGVPEMLDQLRERDVPLAVLSNKPHDSTVACVEALFDPTLFAAVRGHVDGTAVKPDPQTALAMVRDMRAGPRGVWYVGDSSIDMQLARNAGFVGVGVAWGFRGRDELAAHGATHIIDHPAELVTLIETD